MNRKEDVFVLLEHVVFVNDESQLLRFTSASMISKCMKNLVLEVTLIDIQMRLPAAASFA